MDRLAVVDRLAIVAEDVPIHALVRHERPARRCRRLPAGRRRGADNNGPARRCRRQPGGLRVVSLRACW